MAPVKGRAGTPPSVNPKPGRGLQAPGTFHSAGSGAALFLPTGVAFHFGKAVSENGLVSGLPLPPGLGVGILWPLEWSGVCCPCLMSGMKCAGVDWRKQMHISMSDASDDPERQTDRHIPCPAVLFNVIITRHHRTISSFLVCHHHRLTDAIKTSRFHFTTHIMSSKALTRLFHASV